VGVEQVVVFELLQGCAPANAFSRLWIARTAFSSSSEWRQITFAMANAAGGIRNLVEQDAIRGSIAKIENVVQ
jgi:hypothetical protein